MLIRLRGNWLTASDVDRAVQSGGVPSVAPAPVTLQVTSGTKMLLDACVRLFAYSKQIIAQGIPVRLVFEDGPAMGYLDRVG